MYYLLDENNRGLLDYCFIHKKSAIKKAKELANILKCQVIVLKKIEWIEYE